jgi:hypothetical protein
MLHQPRSGLAHRVVFERQQLLVTMDAAAAVGHLSMLQLFRWSYFATLGPLPATTRTAQYASGRARCSATQQPARHTQCVLHT